MKADTEIYRLPTDRKSKNAIIRLMNKHRKLLYRKQSRCFYIHVYDAEERRYITLKQEDMISDIAYVDMRLNGLSLKILQMNPDVLRSLGILKKTVLEQMVATRDIIMILDPDYGCGHTRTYFSTPWKRETEFVVYCLNNTFNPNMVFRKYLPDLYDDMIQYVKDYL